MSGQLQAEEIRRRQLRWILTAVAIATSILLIDAVTSPDFVLISMLAVAPFIAAVGATRRQTLFVALYAIALTIPTALVDHIFGSFEHVMKAFLIAAASLFAVRVAQVRERAELSSALDYAVANALATSSTLAEATPKLLQSIGSLLRHRAGAIWELGPDDERLRCVETWCVPTSALERFAALNRAISFQPGIGLPGRIWRSGEPAFIPDITLDSSFARGQAATAAGLAAAIGFPVGDRQRLRGVVEFYPDSPREPDSELLPVLARIGRQIGQHMERRKVEEAVRQSEALRGAVLTGALDSVITMNHEGLIVEFNPAAERTFGYRSSDVVGKPLGDLVIPPALRKRHAEGLAHYLESGESKILGRRLELMGMRADGSEFPVEIAVTRIGMTDPPMFAGYLRDLTERRRAEEDVQRLAAIVEHSNDAVIAVSTGGEIIAWNPGAERLYGYTPDEVLGKNISITAPPGHEYESAELIAAADRGEIVENHQTIRRRKDGSLVDVSLTLSPLRDADGALIGTAGILRDISHQKREERRTAFIAEAVDVLDSSLDYHEVVRKFVRLVVPRIADWCALHTVEPDGSLRLLAVGHSEPEREQLAWELDRRYPTHFDQPEGIPQVVRTGEAQLMPEITDEMLVAGAQDEQHLEIMREVGLRSAMAIPLRARGQTLGAMTFVSTESGRTFDQEDLEFGMELAARAALSIDNARLYAEAESRRQELEFLALASVELDAALELDVTLQRLADISVPYLADGCMVDVIDETEQIQRVASATNDPEVAPVLDRLRSHHIHLDGSHPIAAALRTGELQHVREVTDELRQEWSPDSSYLEAVRAWPARAAVVAPLRARGRTLGTIALASFGERRFSPREIATIQELARRASVAIDNARLYSERSYIASRLQQSLLPPHLPDVPGLEIAARFRPAGEAFEVGGDFYDIFEASHGTWAIVIGDVCGKGADAAALTALARYTIRATAIRAAQRPERVLTLLNDVLLGESPREQFLTAAYASLRVEPEGTELLVASAGHPLPLLLRADGTLEQVGDPGTLLGVVPEIEVHSTRLELQSGDTVVFYTDGVTEARTTSGEMFGVDGLLSAVSACVGCDAAEVAQRIETSLSDARVERPRDDIAIVVVQVAGDGGTTTARVPALAASD